jgi:phosphatidylglycerophosphate synthase
MPKLSSDNSFLDLSDYGRPPALYAARLLAPTFVTPVQVTLLFGLCGLVAIYALLHDYLLLAGGLLILKSVIDAVDGELARIRQRPSYTGRYLDSVLDNLLNLLLFTALGYHTDTPLYLSLIAYACVQLQGTLYNYYYVILRRQSEGADTTSRVFETRVPEAFPYENQRVVAVLFGLFMALYGPYDRIVYTIERSASEASAFPAWFMSMVSVYGLGFQLLLIALLLAIGGIAWIIPFFIFYTLWMIVLVTIRKTLLT